MKLDVRAPAAPFLAFVASARRERDRLGLCFAVLIALHALAVVATGVSPAAARFFMRRFQLQTESFAGWALGAAMPWMYNFENRVRVSDSPIPPQQRADGAAWQFQNHQPARAFTFADGRARFLARPGVHYFYLETRYRDQVVRNAYAVDVPQPSVPARPARVRRIEGDR